MILPARSALFVSLFLTVACSEADDGAGRAAGPGGKRQNLILVSLDTCRSDRLSLYGAERETSPRLDAFAQEAAVFEDCLAQSALTAPSHLSMLTGHYVHRHGLLNNQGSATPPYSLASMLRDLGWRTGAFTGHGSFQAKHGLDHGFDTFQSTTQTTEDDLASLTRNLDEVVPHALDWLDENQEAPFFLLVHAYDPHCPFWPPEPWKEEFAGWYDGELDLSDVCHPKAFRSLIDEGGIQRREVRWIHDLYDAEIAAADAVLGGFLDELERRGLLDDSIVVFTSDHGEVLGNHGWIGHGQVWEEALKVPLVLRFPGGHWAGRHDDLVQLVDLTPTLLSALGVPPPPGLQGVDLMPLVRGETDDAVSADRMRLARVGESPNRIALRYGRRWKFVFEEQADGSIAALNVFDLQSDPSEANDLIRTSEGRQRFQKALDRYSVWRRETAAEDARFQGDLGSSIETEADRELLEALGYGGDE